jgi:hypothetical protein
MNKKYLLIGIGVMICLAVFVVAEGLTHTITIGQERKTALASMGITNPRISDMICDKGFCSVTISQYKTKNVQKETCDKGKCTNQTIQVEVIIFQTRATIEDKGQSNQALDSEMQKAVTNKLATIADSKISSKSNKGGASELILR